MRNIGLLFLWLAFLLFLIAFFLPWFYHPTAGSPRLRLTDAGLASLALGLAFLNGGLVGA